VANEPSKYGGLAMLRDEPASTEKKRGSTARPTSKASSDSRGGAPEEKSTAKSNAGTGRGGALSLPSRQLTGKRSSADYRQKSVLLKVVSIDQAEQLLRKNHKGTDFSELMQALLDKWLAEPS